MPASIRAVAAAQSLRVRYRTGADGAAKKSAGDPRHRFPLQRGELLSLRFDLAAIRSPTCGRCNLEELARLPMAKRSCVRVSTRWMALATIERWLGMPSRYAGAELGLNTVTDHSPATPNRRNKAAPSDSRPIG